MIKWASPMAKTYQTMVSNLLINITCDLEQNITDEYESEIFDDIFGESVVEMFSKEGIIKHIHKIIEIHNDQKTYQISDYYYLLIDRALVYNMICYNDEVSDNHQDYAFTIDVDDNPDEIEDDGIVELEDGYIVFIDHNSFIDYFFWDTDYDMKAEVYSQMTDVQKDITSYSTETFGVINRMMPHADELIPVLCDTESEEN